jgi:hypothetical protein
MRALQTAVGTAAEKKARRGSDIHFLKSEFSTAFGLRRRIERS